ncbi:hypothetical protein BAUCODRAFT_150345 [Baudoinia panamericana UAMH 10762]|uniref:Ubiquitin-like protease family profile domain-containing protein n=1 Tax=Baudoinia panamericana (strain UAMH 10762) TaxID=717646 RepID=M2MRN3_BAUPA|nr:uncharacterized protein BAUCODRAFT_150345 [Baudoinia panamericana UAMH 10762]EMC94138.1 hypothetical protein BAUCODRAFT_150345 [Baudoinia panamericana UAMH 10762]
MFFRLGDTDLTHQITSIKEYIWGGRTAIDGHDESPTNTSTVDKLNSSGRSHARNTDGADDEVVEVSQPRDKGGARKRGREVESVQLPSAKRQQQGPSELELRLVGDYAVPAKARAIVFPGPWQENRTSAKPGMGGPRVFRPQNTLNDDPYAAERTWPGTPRPTHQGSQSDFWDDNKSAAKQKQTVLPMVASKDSNVSDFRRQIPRYANAGNGFTDGSNERRAKKPKTSHHTKQGTLMSDPVDLTSNEEDEAIISAPVAAMNGRQTASAKESPVPSIRVRSTASSGSHGTQHSHARKEQRPMTALQASNQHMLKPKPPRKPRNDDAFSKPSSRGASIASQSGGNSTGARAAPSSIEVLDERVTQVQSGTVHNNRSSSRNGEVPEICLDRDTNEYVDQTVLRRTADQARRANDAWTDCGKEAQARQQMRNDTKRNAQAQRRSIDEETAVPAPEHAANEQSRDAAESTKRLGQIFVREEADESISAEPKKQKASQQMMVNSRVSPIKESLSDDELQGGNTVPSEHFRNVSPAKRPTDHRTRRSPSDIKPTPFKESCTWKKQPVEKPHEARADPEEWPVIAFYSKSYCTTRKTVKLKYDEHENSLEVYEDGMPAVITGKQRSVGLGPSEVRTIKHSKHNTRVYITGSVTDVSNGHICIAFSDERGVNWFLGRIMLATNHHVTIKHIEDEQLNKTFFKQSAEITEAFERAKANPAARKPANQSSATHRSHRLDDENDEHIIYDKMPVTRKNVRQSMVGGEGALSAANVGEDAATSRHLDNAAEPRRSARERKSVVERAPSPTLERWTVLHKPKRWPHPVAYPPQGLRRVTVEFDDLERLDEGEFLNDNIISFALRKAEEEMKPELKERVHFFNTFFYTTLTTKNGKKEFNYKGVQRWTKNKDLLGTPYIVVPINIHMHWIVAIICNLDKLSRKPALFDKAVSDDESDGSIRSEGEAASGPQKPAAAGMNGNNSNTADVLIRQEVATNQMHDLSLSDDGRRSSHDSASSSGDDGKARAMEALASNLKISTATRKKKGRKKPAAPVRKFSPDAPTIICLDSFGNARATEMRNLKDYIVFEAEAKRAMKVDREDIQGINAKGIPEQTNFCDCGVYLIGYIEAFARDPDGFVKKVITRQMDKQADFANFNPSEKRAQIREQLLALEREQTAARVAAKKAKAGVGKASPAAASETTTAERAASRIAASAAASPRDSPGPLQTKQPPSQRPEQSKQSQPPPSARQPPSAQQEVFSTKAQASSPASHSRSRANEHRPRSAQAAKEPAMTAQEAKRQRPAFGPDDGDADKLEAKPARPLPPSGPGRNDHLFPSTRIIVPHDDWNGSQSGDEDDDNAGMLDHPNNNARNSNNAQAVDADQESPLLDHLSKSLIASQESDAIVPMSQQPTSEGHVQHDGVTTEAAGDNQTQDSLVLLDVKERPAEVADSQEGWQASNFRTPLAGKRTSFTD